MLHSPCPMVVTLYDLAALKRPSERLRGGGIHLRLRHLALQRASHVIVPTEVVAHEAVAELGLERERVAVIPEAPDLAPLARGWEDAARETWSVYQRTLAHPHRPCVTSRAGRGSVSPAPREHSRDRLQQDREVHRQRPVLQVEEVQVHEVVEVELRAA